MIEQPGQPGRPDNETTLQELILLAPRLVRLIYKLLFDPRVPPRSKAILVLVAGYLVLPFDFVPDFIPIIGQADDLVLAAFALDQILNRVPDSIVREHWEGDEDVLAIVRQVLDISTTRINRIVGRFLSG
ncbi:MAG: DUF1232 domain-containing protein [Actinobacteria bacterium]|nr:DUF1232 domain-containing protein [Actinomycetota bacterium]